MKCDFQGNWINRRVFFYPRETDGIMYDFIGKWTYRGCSANIVKTGPKFVVHFNRQKGLLEYYKDGNKIAGGSLEE